MTFKTQMTTDLSDVFFSADEFGVSASLKCGIAAPVTITVILETPYERIGDLEGAVSGYMPTALAKTADLADASIGDKLTIDDVTYYIQGMQPDEDGHITTVLLSEES